MALKNLVFKHPEVSYSINQNFYIKNIDSSLEYTDHTEEITGITKIKDYWVTSSLDKSVKFLKIDWNSKKIVKEYETKHKKKISCVQSNEKYVFYGDKTGEIWRIDLESLESGPDTEYCTFFIGHQATVEFLWCDSRYLISVDSEFKIKVSQDYGVIEYIFLGYDSKVISAVFFKGKFYTCDDRGNFKTWIDQNHWYGVRLTEPLKLYGFNEILIGISDTQTFLIDYTYLQAIPIKDSPVLVDYPHFCVFQENILETELNFDPEL